jgi:hypothetical protein
MGRVDERLKKHSEIAFCTIASDTVVDLHIMHFKDVLQMAICTTEVDCIGSSQP